MPNDAYTQQALAADGHFRSRVRSALSSVAWQVSTEDPSTANHDARVKYAKQVIRNLDQELSVILPSFVMRPNVNNFETSYFYDFVDQVGYVQTLAGDADLQSQLFSDWDIMSAAAGNAGPVAFAVPPVR
jgi:hypothetical protein